ALLSLTGETQAFVDGAGATAASVRIAADSDNTAVTTAKASPGGSEGNNASPKSRTNDHAKTSDGDVAISAALAFNIVDVETLAWIAAADPLGTTTVTSAGAQVVHAGLHNAVTADADGTTVETLATGVGVAVAVNVATPVTTSASVERAAITGSTVTLEATAPSKSTYTATAKSGAGASNVGVAGSLALNVVTTTATAAPVGAPVFDGDLVLSATSNNETTATSQAKEDG
ncbi:MAG TPA: hypothetical protein VFW74_14075, partial [Acidimicrobiia bacterium]|nr:hypothetical protein [Acidimicrobiia bacterium]